MELVGSYHSIESLFDDIFDYCDLSSRDFFPEFLDILESHLLVFSEETLILLKILNSLDSFVIEFSGCCGSNTPHLTERIHDLILLIPPIALQLAHLPSLNEFQYFLHDPRSDMLDMYDVSFIFDFDFESSDSCHCLAVGAGPAFVLLELVDLLEAHELFADEVVEGFGVEG